MLPRHFFLFLVCFSLLPLVFSLSASDLPAIGFSPGGLPVFPTTEFPSEVTEEGGASGGGVGGGPIVNTSVVEPLNNSFDPTNVVSQEQEILDTTKSSSLDGNSDEDVPVNPILNLQDELQESRVSPVPFIMGAVLVIIILVIIILNKKKKQGALPDKVKKY